MERIDCDVCAVDLLAFYEANAELLQLNRKLQDTILNSTAGSKALVPGRLILVNSPVRTRTTTGQPPLPPHHPAPPRALRPFPRALRPFPRALRPFPRAPRTR